MSADNVDLVTENDQMIVKRNIFYAIALLKDKMTFKMLNTNGWCQVC